MAHGVESVVTPGMMMMLELSADNLDIQIRVSLLINRREIQHDFEFHKLVSIVTCSF